MQSDITTKRSPEGPGLLCRHGHAGRRFNPVQAEKVIAFVSLYASWRIAVKSYFQYPVCPI